ncbi:hypothetical protein Kirov_266 [Bacillus phage Kirov]|uniref:Uncharacterized protein n=1 Tax=Bacillus phage Kirov TaxID=2783539 RepID=A0A7U3RYD8_9CAUD|nr:hypothetical protein PQE67_gp038 [Bacillus phage Kirov]QOV08465.1 hypothetical protein Kirov_266 [Bacillus phage Kirov]
MRTTNKNFVQQVQNHIIDRLNDEYHSTVKEQLQNVVNEFNNYDSAYERRKFPNKQDNLINFFSGLPTCIHMEYSHYNVHISLKEWFENCGAEYIETDEQKEWDVYRKLFSREFMKLCQQYDVKF